MIPVLIRAVIFGLAVYLLSKLGRSLIDKLLDGPKGKERTDDTKPPGTGKRSHLVPCPECGVYYDAANPRGCTKCNDSANDE